MPLGTDKDGGEGTEWVLVPGPEDNMAWHSTFGKGDLPLPDSRRSPEISTLLVGETPRRGSELTTLETVDRRLSMHGPPPLVFTERPHSNDGRVTEIRPSAMADLNSSRLICSLLFIFTTVNKSSDREPALTSSVGVPSRSS